jgi:hypothetical protein
MGLVTVVGLGPSVDCFAHVGRLGRGLVTVVGWVCGYLFAWSVVVGFVVRMER